MQSAAAPPESIHVDEAQARRLALAEAIDGADPDARLVGRVERDQLEREALAATGDPAAGQPLDPKAYLLARADRLLALVAHRQPRVAALQDAPAWHAWAAWGLPAAALLAGGAIERIDNPQQVNLLSPPLLAFLFWNLAVYLLLAVSAFARRPARGMPRWWGRWLRSSRDTGAWRARVEGRFRLAWWRLAGSLESLRWQRILHASAAAWAVGVALSIVLGGLVREYRIGWESTLLELPQVHAFLRALFWPVVALTPLEPFTLQELERLHFRTGQGVGREEARRWVFMYVALLGLVVVVPRLLLAGLCALRQRRRATALVVDVSDAYYTPLLGRVRPARVVLRVAGGAGVAPGAFEVALRQAGGSAPPADLRDPWIVLTTDRGDVLACEASPTGHPVEPAAAGRPWWRLPGAGRDLARPASGDVLVLPVAGDPGASRERLDALSAASTPVLLLLAAGASEAEWMRLLRDARLRGEVLPLAALATWQDDARLRSAIARLLPAWKAPGMERLSAAWAANAQARLDTAMRLLAGELLLATRDTQSLAGAPVGMRQLVVREERDAQQESRREAAAALLARWRERQAANDAKLLALHALDGVLPAAGWRPEWPRHLQVQQAVHEPQAGLAGAASGAAMGAAVDLMTGGLTLGAAAAIGALVGGGAALVGAAWKNRGTEPGVANVAASDDMLLALTQGALVRYLAVVHEGRAAADVQRWTTAAEAIVQRERDTLRPIWAEARLQGGDAALEARLSQCLQRMARQAVAGPDAGGS